MHKKLSFVSHNISPLSSHPALEKYIVRLGELKEHDAGKYDTPESALYLPLDGRVQTEVKRAAKKCASEKLKYVVVIGIGGSNLGTKAVYDAFRGPYDLACRSQALREKPKLLFLDTISDGALHAVREILEREVESSEELLVNLISKSGTTTESIANFELLHQALLGRFSDLGSRVVVTTDHHSALWKEGERRGFELLAIPKQVGGRFSVFSAVGLFPLLCAGIDIEKFCLGADEMLERVVSSNRETNCARKAAEELFAAMRSGCSMLNLFSFHPELESLGKWERQLFAESLGKEKDLAGNIVHAGVTPIVSIASTDLHSMAQLYFGGPRNKFTMLIRAKANDKDGVGMGDRIPEHGPLAGLVPAISGRHSGEIIDAIYKGVSAAYAEHSLPYCEVALPGITSYALGAYMEWRMATVMQLATLMDVNPFDQPNVEDYKKVTRAILGSSK